jgi:glucose/arabinose dehydrogenase
VASAIVLGLIVACSSDDGPKAPALRGPDPCKAPSLPASSITLAPAFGAAKFTQPVELVAGPEGSDEFYVLEQAGLVKKLTRDGTTTTVYDVTTRINGTDEAGLLGIAFDPKYAENHFAYLYFTEKTTKAGFVQTDKLVRVTSFDATTEKVLLALDDPFPNHNGGHLAFGPDGGLFLGIGDGGGANDPLGYGQNPNVFFGKILRFDTAASPDKPPAIWALGFRNPWKFSFDSVTNQLWVGDVGEKHREEIDLVTHGGNYGWNTREGKSCAQVPDCSSAGLIDPVVDYTRDQGIAVTGGYVYRGTKIPSLTGKLIYGDFGSGNIWSVDQGSAAGALLVASGKAISSFGRDSSGELYVVDYGSGNIFSLEPGGGAAPPPATLLSATGCSKSADAINYDVASPLWSDGADKARWLFLPDGKKIDVKPDGDFDVPTGSVAVKTFSIAGKKVETRLFAHYDDGSWAGWSYEWNDDQKDAVLLDGGKDKVLPNGQTWTFPSRSQCLQCHTAAAGFTLGLEARQVDVNLFARDLASPVPEPLKKRFDPNDVAAYLHANCSQCHRPGGGAGAATMDLRFDANFVAQTCGVPPNAGDLGDPNARLMLPGRPQQSILLQRMSRRDEAQMPPLATHIVDPHGVDLVSTFIGKNTICF